MIIKTEDLNGPALDWAVAKCEGRPWPDNAAIFLGEQYYRPSTDWAHGGPLIEKDILVVSPDPARGWYARSFGDAVEYYGSTPLIAAMRCLVAGRLGEEIDVPDDLCRAATNDDVLAGFKDEFEVFKKENAALIADLHLEMKGRANALSEFLLDQVGGLKSKLGSDAANAAGDDKGAQERAIEGAEAWVADNVSCQVREEIAAVLWLNGAEEGAELIRANISKLQRGVRP